ncbi:hypothetical protein SAMN02745216_00028 [Desulfatibacillum alkenivorans DSM 16219]|jgi:hypothetical protein|uniref:Uncharacterized protein n=1 Tax=Desulfatibacillum alkenivorans DSM 16219 TaxID=1121393 RepID=A0A1M6BN63_9BACT|nr:hypothetical protein [Desulfatibacillum alkenivorans]SHI50097.1 hypothetical protein SAMN02745216_00028 [Desulfatibacillum alkenivorans DSM 16219]
MQDKMLALEDRDAVRIFTAMAKMIADGQEQDAAQGLSPEMARALTVHFGEPDGKAAAGDLARRGLLVLAQSPEYKDRLEHLVKGPPPQAFDMGLGATAAILTAAIVVLQTEVAFVKDKKGKTTLKIKKKALSENFLTDFVKKLLSVAKGG